MIFQLIFGHIVADFVLQNDFMAKAKNHVKPIEGIPPLLILSYHSFIHSFVVYLITGKVSFAIFEFIAHFLLDFAKNARILTFSQDQFGHLVCKVGYYGLF